LIEIRQIYSEAQKIEVCWQNALKLYLYCPCRIMLGESCS